MDAFELLKETKKAYVVCSIGQKYIDFTEFLILGLKKYSKYPVILFYDDGYPNYKYDNLITQPLRLPLKITDAEHSSKFKTIFKSFSTLMGLKNYNVDSIVMLDSDIIVTNSIDDIFRNHESLIENYPIFIRYSWNHISVMGRPHVSDYIKDFIGAKHQTLPAICSCACIANRNCLNFLEDWNYYCGDEGLFNYHYVLNKEIYFDLNDESVVNALLWKYGAIKYLECNFMWATNYSSVKFAFDFYDGSYGNLPYHESYPSHYRVPQEFEVPFGLSVLPEKMKNLWGFHGGKDFKELVPMTEEIEKRFFYE